MPAGQGWAIRQEERPVGVQCRSPDGRAPALLRLGSRGPVRAGKNRTLRQSVLGKSPLVAERGKRASLTGCGVSA